MTEKIKKAAGNHAKLHAMVGTSPFEKAKSIFEAGANYALSNLWNKVEDGLPEKEGEYLTYNSKFKNYHVQPFHPKLGRFINVHTSHWMSIPEVK